MKNDRSGKRLARVARRAAARRVKPRSKTAAAKPKGSATQTRRRPALRTLQTKHSEAKPAALRGLAADVPSGPHRMGFVSIAGRPNAGKSTLLNALVGEKVAIVAHQAQTTRTTIQGIVNVGGAQIVLVDTPGIHKSDTLFNRSMMNTVRGALEEMDVALFVADATKPPSQEDGHAVSAVPETVPVLLVLNKIDRLEDKRLLLPLIEAYMKLRQFDEVFPVSGLKGTGLDELMSGIIQRIPEGEALYPEDQYTDLPKRFLTAELIREAILRETTKEVPHSVGVVIDDWEEERSLTKIGASIIVERPGHKAILIGAGGSRLKKIGAGARREIEEMLGEKVFLSLFVRVQPKWREDLQFLSKLDWRSMLGSE